MNKDEDVVMNVKNEINNDVIVEEDDKKEKDTNKLKLSKIVSSYMKKQKGHLVGSILLTLVPMIRSTITPHLHANFIKSIEDENRVNLFKYTTGIASMELVGIADNTATIVLMNDIHICLKQHICEHVLFHYLNSAMIEEIDNSALLYQIELLSDDLIYYFQYLFDITHVLSSVLGGCISAFRTDYILGTCMLGVVGASIASVVLPHFLDTKPITNHNDGDTKLTAEIDDIIINRSSIISSNTIDFEIERLREIAQTLRKKSVKKTARTWKFIGCLVGISVVLCVFFVVRLINIIRKSKKEDRIVTGTGQLSVVTKTLYNVNKIAYKIPSMSSEYIVMKDIIKRINEQTSRIVRPKSDSPERLLESLESYELSLKNVSFSYNADTKPVIDNMSIDFKENSINVITGPIGCGKTTILKLIRKLIIPTSGNITIGKRNINEVDLSKIVGYVQQKATLFNRSLFENIIYGNDDVDVKSYEKVKSILNDLDIMQDKDIYTCVGKRGDILSGGQRQIITILRMMMRESYRILILDEPTASVDESLRKKIIEILFNYKYTIILSSHDKTFINALSNDDRFRIHELK